MKIRRIKTEKIKNARDLGGFPAAGGKMIRKKSLIRSGHLANATESDLRLLCDEYNLGTVIDLRTEAEIKEKPEMLPENVAAFSIPLLDNSFLGIARDEFSIRDWFNVFKDTDKKPVDVFCEMYDALVFGDRSKELIPKFFEILLENNGSAVLWHCSAGKDRVGITTMLLLLALGVEREIIYKDYIATRYFTAKDIILMRVFSPFVLRNIRLVRCLAVLMGVKRVYLEKIFQRIDNEYESVEDFFEKQYGISRDKLSMLRDKYLV